VAAPASSYQVITKLEETGRTVEFRAMRQADLRPVLLKVLGPERPNPRDVTRLENEYETAHELSTPSVLKPLALGQYQGMPALALEDFGGRSLDHLIGQPTEPRRFLALAVRIAAALANVHQQGIIHKDIKPRSLVFDETTAELKITDFGIATRLPREQQAQKNPALIEGTLPYMSPEQTGRMNRAIDHRSDLYSLGVTFFQMLTGRLPFSAQDPLEWAFCHIAQSPPAPTEIVPELPQILAQIVLRLLAKTPEERYQSAFGVQYDLERCIAAWEATGTIPSFPLGERDLADRLQIPQTLYGRERETAALKSVFDRVARSGKSELLLVSGYAGVGKSSLVHELSRSIARKRGLFIEGKFDQLERDIPYSTIVQAFTQLVLDIQSENEERRRRSCDDLQAALGSNGKLIIDLIPQLALLIGEQPPVAELAPTEAEHRFRRVFRRFVSVFARRENPLVLFLDDLHWVDGGSLKLIEDIVTEAETGHLLLIGAYRDNEVTSTHPLVLTLERIRRSGAGVNEFVLAPLGFEHLLAFVADTVHAERDAARPLAALVDEKTGGNPFFVVQFLTMLHQQGLLRFDAARRSWEWDSARIRERGYTDNVVDFMVRRLAGLPTATRRALEIAACIGNKGSIAVLAEVQGRSEKEVLGDLWDAIREGLIVCSQGSYFFQHDRVQQAAYCLLPASPEVHLRVGRILLARTPEERLGEQIFDVVTQLNHGAALLTDPTEKTHLAQLNLLAGRKAKAASAFRSAIGYFFAGALLLGADGWPDDASHERHALAYALHLEHTECELLTGNLDEAERLLPPLFRHARTKFDSAAAFRIKTTIHIGKGETVKDVESALECLRLFGIEIPAHPTWGEVLTEYEAIWRNLATRRIEELVDLPPMSDPEMQVAMRVLAQLYGPAIWSDCNLLIFTFCRMVNISLRYGNADASVYAYGIFGLILGAAFHRYQEGYRFAKLGFDITERRGLLAYKTKVNYVMEMVCFWSHSIDRMLEYLQVAFDAVAETGDVEVAGYCCNHVIIDRITRGDSLEDVHRESQRRIDFVLRHGFPGFGNIILSMQLYVQNMRGRTRHFSTFDDEAGFRQDAFEEKLARPGIWYTMSCWYYVMKLMARFMSGDYDEALAAGAKSQELLWASIGHVQVCHSHFYYALTLAAACEQRPREQRAETLALVDSLRVQLAEWDRNNPQTFHCLHALVEAELARLKEQPLEAMSGYEEAIRSARAGGFVQNEGIAYEVAARFYRERRFEPIADAYLREARSCYVRWGADGKVRQLDHLYPQLVERRPTALTVAMPPEELDLQAVIKASQSVSREIVRERLVGTLRSDLPREQAAYRCVPARPPRGARVSGRAGGDLPRERGASRAGTRGACLGRSGGAPRGVPGRGERALDRIAAVRGDPRPPEPPLRPHARPLVRDRPDRKRADPSRRWSARRSAARAGASPAPAALPAALGFAASGGARDAIQRAAAVARPRRPAAPRPVPGRGPRAPGARARDTERARRPAHRARSRRRHDHPVLEQGAFLREGRPGAGPGARVARRNRHRQCASSPADRAGGGLAGRVSLGGVARAQHAHDVAPDHVAGAGTATRGADARSCHDEKNGRHGRAAGAAARSTDQGAARRLARRTGAGDARAPGHRPGRTRSRRVRPLCRRSGASRVSPLGRGGRPHLRLVGSFGARAGRGQPLVQRHQVRPGPTRRSPHRQGERPRAPSGPGPRHRHRSRTATPHLRSLRACRLGQPLRRPWARALHLPSDRRRARWLDHRGE
jgi:predicted ATPase